MNSYDSIAITAVVVTALAVLHYAAVVFVALRGTSDDRCYRALPYAIGSLAIWFFVIWRAVE